MVCEAWNIETTGWLASAGVVGVAVGFASQETLSNLIAGVFILADAPYKLGDFLDLGNGTRGKVVEIGIRTTRLMTPEDIEIIVPNSLMASSQITNQSGGPWVKFRVSVEAGVAYGTDIDLVRKLLLEEADGIQGVAPRPHPQVRFKTMADSALIFALNVWVEEPGLRDGVVDQLNTRIYKRLCAEKIEIPYPKQDVYMYAQPTPEA
jgi:small-conductance mechanosensitive channel